jgi:nucleotide-binding universal stress UspA family protein
MAIKDILLPLIGYPEPPTDAAIRACAAIGGYIGAHISAIGVDVDMPASSIAFSAPGHFAGVATAERAIGHASAEDLLKVFLSAAGSAQVRNDRTAVRWSPEDLPTFLANRARLKDLSLLPIKPQDGVAEKMLEALIFASGRPLLIFPEPLADRLLNCFDHVAIAWDHSPQAARAVAEALPLLQMAKTIHIFTATDQITAAGLDSGAALVGHLAEHDIKSVFETIKIGGSSVGKVFDAYVKANKIDLLVMGAYGHSRVRELIWGGATRTILDSPPCWVLMSH